MAENLQKTWLEAVSNKLKHSSSRFQIKEIKHEQVFNLGKQFS